jgi:AcrR family transcriptional regulator
MTRDLPAIETTLLGWTDEIGAIAAGLFRRQGFHGTSTREIAEKAGVSLGNIYNHFPNKEAMFATLLKDCEEEYFSPSQPLHKVFMSTDFPANIEALGAASGRMVEKFGDYMLLMYVDVVEFDAKHISRLFTGIEKSEQKRTNLVLVETSGQPCDTVVKVSDADGAILASQTYSLTAGEYKNIVDLFGDNGVALGEGPFQDMTVTSEVTSGTCRAVGLASVIDNQSKNPQIFVLKAPGPPGGGVIGF